MRPVVPRTMLTTLCVLALFGCSDRGLPTGANLRAAPEPQALGRIVGEQDCTIEADAGRITCKASAPPSSVSGPRRALLGTAQQVRFIRTGGRRDTLAVPSVLEQEMVIQNMLNEPLGTQDGVTITGFKVLVADGPVVTAYYNAGDTGTVRVINADGYGNYTNANQPYWHSSEIVQPGDSSSVRTWKFAYPRTVKTASFKLWVFAMTPSDTPVPATAPDHTPAGFGDPQFSSRCRGIMTDTCLRNVVVVDFKAGSTREERQAAFDRIGGTVVGGNSIGYYAQVADDSTLLVLKTAIATLRTLPQVRYAGAFSTAVLVPDQADRHLESYDEPGWRDWQLNPALADGRNWALERIAAPIAWGCNVGDTTTAVAIVDNGFHDVSDLRRNAKLALSVGWNHYASQPELDHGTRVAAVAAGRGNDSVQVSGVMPRASLRLYDASFDSAGTAGALTYDNVFTKIRKAGTDGARVINVSLGYVWADTAGVRRDPGAETDTAQIRQDAELVASWYQGFRMRMDALANAGRRPLVVFSAGNQTLDAKWNVARTAVDSAAYRDQVLVVGASDIADHLAAFSNTGAVVQIAAPGDRVFVLHSDGVVDSARSNRANPHTGSGTSFAAPHVTGVAGLLAAFDSTLTAGEIKSLILLGARRGGRIAGTAPVLNALESLKAAAQRTGAPLCGNPVYRDTLGNVFTRRDTLWGSPEQLFTTPDTTLFPLHGARLVRLAGTAARRWTNTGSWTAMANAGDTTGNASVRSKAARSHDGDSVFTVVKGAGADARRDEVYDIYLNGAHWYRLDNNSYAALPHVDLMSTTTTRCVKWPTVVNNVPNNEFGVCTDQFPLYDRISSTHSLTFSSARGELILAIALHRDQRTIDLNNPFVHGGDWNRLHEAVSEATGTHLLFIRVRNKAIRSFLRTGSQASKLAVSEDGRSLVMQRVFRSQRIAYNVVTGGSNFRNLLCDASYQRIVDTPTLSTQQVFQVGGGSRSDCLPETTFAP